MEYDCDDCGDSGLAFKVVNGVVTGQLITCPTCNGNPHGR